MKIYMIYDHEEKEYLNDGYLNPYCFSSSEKAEKFLREYNSECGTLKSRKEKKGIITCVYRIIDDEYDVKYDIFEVEIDQY